MDLKSLTRAQIESLADTRGVFQRGEEYAQSGAILQFSRTPTGITALVHGTYGNYTVTVTNDLALHCTCPYEGTVCKHMVAVLLQSLESGGAEIAAAGADTPSPLEQTVADLPPDELRNLVLRLTRDDPEVRRALLENVTIPPALLRQQPHDQKRVKALKKAVERAFDLDNTRHDDDYWTQDDGITVDISSIVDAALMLHPDDQTEVFWHIVVQANKYFEQYGLNTAPIEQALSLYADAVAQQELPPEDKRYYFETLIGARDWDMCGYGDVTVSIKEALDVIATTPDDYRHLIQALKRAGDDEDDEGEVHEWVISYYKKLGEDDHYLRARQANLRTEAHFLELADFWLEKGEETKALATLEAWVARLGASQERVGNIYYSRGGGEVLKRLIAYYEAAEDNANLCRILMAQTQQEGVTLALYQRVQAVANKLGTWLELRPELLKRSQGEERARIYLHEQDWTRAIEFARLSGRYGRVREIVADSVKESFPEESISLYDSLVQENIGRSNREGYHIAARYTEKIKTITLTILKDREAWEEYITDIRKTHARRPALLDEFRGL